MSEEDKILEELYEKYPIDEIVKFNELDIQEKLKDNAFLTVKYGDLYERERNRYEKYSEMLEALLGQRYDFYKFESEKTLQKPEIEKYYLASDEKVRKMKAILRKQEVRMNFFKLCVEALKKQSWNMKLFTDRDRWNI